MELIHDLQHAQLQPNVATIGFFDGVHLGHQFLIQQVIQQAKIHGFASSVITFTEHPRRVMQQSYQPQLLTTLEEKCELLNQLPLDYTVLLPFTIDMSHMTAREFMLQILKQQLNVQVLVIGYDHRFGHNRAEGFEDYVRYGQEMGIEVIQSTSFDLADHHVSSSVIRTLIQKGEVQEAAQCLGKPYQLEGLIVDGHKMGRKLGFPTANIQVNNPFKLVPERGVYAVWAFVDGQRYKGMLNIGKRPTVNNGQETSIEVYLLHFSGDIYHHDMRVEFVQRLRDERRFESMEELIHQLQSDAHSVDVMLEDAK